MGPKDTVYHLGDFIFAGTKRAHEAYDILIRLNGKKKLIFGNHCHVNMWKHLEAQEHSWYKLNTELLGHYHEMKMDRKTIILCHYAFLHWNKQDYGSFHLHGHHHGNLPFDPTVRRLDVGLDAHPELKLYTWEEIKDIMSKVPWPKTDHHGGLNQHSKENQDNV